MNKALARQLLDDIDNASPDVRDALRFLKDRVSYLLEESRRLDTKLGAAVEEEDKKSRAVIAKEIKEMMKGLLGEDCSTLTTAPQP